jgi:hypothetical protein
LPLRHPRIRREYHAPPLVSLDVYRRVTRALTGRRRGPELLNLEEATRRLQPFSRSYVGVRAIPARQVVGTDSRVSDFDRDFGPRRPDVLARLRRVEAAFPDGNFPPIVVFQLGDAYFVVDGHHRVAIARRRGMELIDADVTLLRARWPLGADADPVELVHAEQERLFMEESGLACVLPGLVMRFSRPVGYLQLLETIELHGHRRMREEGRLLEAHEVAGDWFRREYLPVLEVIRQEGLGRVCRNATESDVFLAAHRRRRELLLECRGTALAEAARQLLRAA